MAGQAAHVPKRDLKKYGSLMNTFRTLIPICVGRNIRMPAKPCMLRHRLTFAHKHAKPWLPSKGPEGSLNI